MADKSIMGFNLSESDAVRFWKMVDKGESNRCWNWTGSTHKLGYGHFKVGGKKGKVAIAHRVAMALSCDDFDESKHYLHSCDNRSCCNPSHLRAGTHDENMRDCAMRMRNRGPRLGNGYTKVAPEKYDEIINMFEHGINKSEIGRRFNVTPTQVSYILKKVGYGQAI